MLEDAGPDIDWDELTFSFTEPDRMYMATCKEGDEWEPGAMQDFQSLSLSPAAGVINYGQGLFEGMKAQYAADGNVSCSGPSTTPAGPRREPGGWACPPFQRRCSWTQ